MKIISFKQALPVMVATALAVTALATPLTAKAATNIFEDAEFIEVLVNHFIEGLAKDQRFTLLVKPNVEDAVPGAVYYVRTPINCQSDLRKATANGERVEINRSLTLDPPFGPEQLKGRVPAMTSVRISSFLGKGAVAAIRTKTGKADVEINAAIQAISKTDAQVLFGKLEYDSLRINQAAKKDLQTRGIAKAADLANEATGVIAPFAQLLFQKFEFNQTRLLAADVGVAVKFLSLFGLTLTGNAKEVRQSVFDLPTNAVFAFKYEPMLFNCN